MARRRFPGQRRRAEAGHGAGRAVGQEGRPARGAGLGPAGACEAGVRFPLGSLDDLKVYTVRGSADVAGATIGGLDLGRLTAGSTWPRATWRSPTCAAGWSNGPRAAAGPPPTEPPTAEGPLPRGGFRGRVRAELAGGQRTPETRDGGVELPIAELINVEPSMVPPSAPRPSAACRSPAGSRSGLGRCPGERPVGPAHLDASPAAPDARGRPIGRPSPATSRRSSPSSAAGWCSRTSPAGWATRRFQGRLGVELAEPWGYDGELAYRRPALPGAARDGPARRRGRSPLEGTIAGRGEARGTLRPWRIAELGRRRRIVGLKAGRGRHRRRPGPMDDPRRDDHRHGRGGPALRRPGLGRGARAGRTAIGPIEGTIKLAKVDAAELSAEGRESWKLTGHADGQVRFRLRPGPAEPTSRTCPRRRGQLTAG